MSDVELTEAFLARIAGWQAMKQARHLCERGQVLSAHWAPPLLKGIVQDGPISFRAGLVIKSAVDVENICTCRPARTWGTLCAHSVAVGLQHLRQSRAKTELADDTAKRRMAPATPAVAPKSSGKRWWLGDESQEAEPAELHIILPPNLEAAIRRGQVMLCLEGAWRDGRGPLTRLPSARAFSWSPQDTALLDRLDTLAAGKIPAALQLPVTDFAALLPLLAAHPRITVGKSAAVTVTTQPWPMPLRATLSASGEIVLQTGTTAAPPLMIHGEWIYQKHTFQPLALPSVCREIFQGPVRLTRPQVPPFLCRDWPGLLTRCQVEADFRVEDFTLEPQSPRFRLHLTGGLAQLTAQLRCAYGPHLLTVGGTDPDEDLWLPDPEQPTRYTTRDQNAERAALGHLVRSGFTAPDGQGHCQLRGQNSVLNFFAREYPRLQQEWDVTLEERLERSTTQNLERLEPRFQIIPAGEHWFDMSIAFDTPGGERFSAAEIQRLILSGQSHRRLRNGKVAILDTGAMEEMQEVLRDCSPQQHEGGYRLSQTQAGFVHASLQQQGWQAEAPRAWSERTRQQSGNAQIVEPPLGELATVLRPYQKEGVAWLHFLRDNGWGGILADEMGLGKTLQALAGLQTAGCRREATGAGDRAADSRRPSLVVCPTSLVFNWVAEATKFTPGLQVVTLHGPGRHGRFAQVPQCDLAITSYALVRRDAQHYRAMEFDTVILDEAQHIKNRQTQNAQAVKAIRARHRLVLTGTPLENSVQDLWSLFDFLMPGYLGAAADFRERYEVPIMRDRDGIVQARLARRLRPFIRRRTKREVAPELPPKLEQVAFCELAEEQRGVYRQVLDASRREILDAVGTQGMARSRLVVFNALLRLRQICCDLRLLPGENVGPEPPSGKLDLFHELLDEVLDGGHRVLVFSQFVSMLTLLRQQLEAKAIPYSYLDGSTVNRGAVVEQFQRDPSIPVFLISLKAGGVGLNLTGADTVIHFDPWWNPAVEDQATDRAHRIGQQRAVTSYQLIARDTVEEKILALQTRKRGLTQATLGSEEQLTGALTWEELQELLA